MRYLHSELFAYVARILFVVINLLALFLLFRGHNEAGGGFIAGLLSAISMVLIMWSGDRKRLQKALVLKPFFLAITGLTLALGVALAPLVVGQPFLSHWHGTYLQTSLVFDLGVFFVVAGLAFKVIHAIRESIPGAEEEEGGKF